MNQESNLPVGKFLDDLPKALYVMAHIIFLGVGVWLWAHAHSSSLPFANTLLLYAVSQIVFFGFFANWITLKMAVLAEQTLVFVMMVLIVIQAA